MVVVPTLLTGPKRIAAITESLELRYWPTAIRTCGSAC